jgi:putative thioredoxin
MMLKPLLEKLGKDFNGRFLLVEMNTDEFKEPARSFAISSLPYLKLYKQGTVVHDFRGGQGEAEFRRILDKFTGHSSDPLHIEGIKLFKEGQTEQAFQVLSRAISNDPRNVKIRLDYAKLLMSQKRLQEAENLLLEAEEDTQDYSRVVDLLAHVRFSIAANEAPDRESLEIALKDDPDNQELRFKLSSVLLMNDEIEGSMNQLLTMLKQDRHYRQELARLGILALFNMLGDDHDMVKAYRPRLMDVISA